MRINEALCMEMNFGNEHVVAVVGFMLALLFCKQMLECLHSLLQVWQSCAAYAACCDYGQEHILRGGMLAAVLTFSVCQPLIYVCVTAAANYLRGREGFWTVNFVLLHFNETAFPHRHSKSESLRRPLAHSIESSCTPVDVQLLIMPFALAACGTTYIWFGKKATGDFQGDPPWDAHLFECRRMQLYEAAYALETCSLLFVLLCLTADPAQLENSVVCAMLCTFIIMYFSAQSRCKSVSDTASENVISIVLFATLNMLISFFVAQHWTATQPVKVSSAVILGSFTLLLVGMHMSVTEETRAGHVILMRTLLSCACSLYFVIMLTVDANSLS